MIKRCCLFNTVGWSDTSLLSTAGAASPAKMLLNDFTFKPQAFNESLWTRLKCRGLGTLITSHATRYGFSFQRSCGKRGETAALPLTNLTSIRHRPIQNWQLLANWMLNKSVSYSAKSNKRSESASNSNSQKPLMFVGVILCPRLIFHDTLAFEFWLPPQAVFNPCTLWTLW